MAITYEEMVPAAKAAYEKENSTRTKVMKVSWFGAALVVIGIIILILGAFISAIINKPADFFNELGLFLLITGLIPICILGCVHCKGMFKGIIKIAAPLLILGWAVAVIALSVALGGAIYGGPVFLIIDTIRYFQKKPLIYNFEHEGFMKTPEAQRELLSKAAATFQNANLSAEDTLKKLKDMFEQGLITEEEYNNKKAELLNRI